MIVGDVHTADHAVEQLSLTNDTSPYTFYEVTLPPLASGTHHALTLPTMNSHVFAVFVDEQLVADNRPGGLSQIKGGGSNKFCR